MKCPIEAGIEILVYNVLDYILGDEDVSLVDINRLWKDRDPRLTTDAGVPDIAILSRDFIYRSDDSGRVYGFIEVKATNTELLETQQTEGQRAATKRYLYTSGLHWKYFENNKNEPKWEKILTDLDIKFTRRAEKVTIKEREFLDLIDKLRTIKWIAE